MSKNHGGLALLEKYANTMKHKYEWDSINQNPAMIPLLERYPEHIIWRSLAMNPSIFESIELDYGAMMSAFHPIAKEIIERVWHPSRMNKWPEPAFEEEEDNAME